MDIGTKVGKFGGAPFSRALIVYVAWLVHLEDAENAVLALAASLAFAALAAGLGSRALRCSALAALAAGLRGRALRGSALAALAILAAASTAAHDAAAAVDDALVRRAIRASLCDHRGSCILPTLEDGTVAVVVVVVVIGTTVVVVVVPAAVVVVVVVVGVATIVVVVVVVVVVVAATAGGCSHSRTAAGTAARLITRGADSHSDSGRLDSGPALLHATRRRRRARGAVLPLTRASTGNRAGVAGRLTVLGSNWTRLRKYEGSKSH